MKKWIPVFAATVQIHEMTGTTTGVDKTSGTVRFKSADETSVDTNNRVQIPGSGTTYSYTKMLRFYFSTGPSTDITNLRAYSDGSNGFGTGVGVQYTSTGSWAANVNTNISGTDLFTKTSGAVIDLDVTNTGPHTSTGYKGDFLRLQLTVADTAGPGQLTAETLTFAYDET
jgi:hypothetical protein